MEADEMSINEDDSPRVFRNYGGSMPSDDEWELKHEKRKEIAREYARRKRKELALVQDKIVSIYNELVRMGVYSKLSDEAREFFDVYVHREERASSPYPANMYKMFGKIIAPGVSCTLKEAMQRLYKGKNEINFMVRKWVKVHGVHVVIEPSETGSQLDTRYCITRVDEVKREKVEDVSEIMSNREKSNFRDFESRKK